jgi:Cof subfamily protein (haloacid dehalogenase superfamily)
MRIHLVAIDLDGTLLNSSKQISAVTSAVLREARHKAGVRIVLATARPPRSVMPYYTALDLDTPMINYNGALVYEPSSKRVLMHRPIPPRTASGIVALARKVHPQVLVSAEILDRWYTDRFDPKYQTETARSPMFSRPDVLAPIAQWLHAAVTKLLLMAPAVRLKLVAAAVKRKFAHQVIMVQTENNLLQIMHATVSKAQALRVVAGELGVTREQVMAIGDNANDVGMLRWAGIGVAMANAHSDALAAADYVTDHHDADGAAKAIQDLIILGKRATKNLQKGL